MIRAETTGASVIINRDRLGLVLWPMMLTRTPLLPLIVGFVAERKAADPKDPASLRNVVLRYPRSGAAAAVAAGMAAGALVMPVDTRCLDQADTYRTNADPVPSRGMPRSTARC